MNLSSRETRMDLLSCLNLVIFNVDMLGIIKFFFKLHSYVDWEKLFANVKVQSCRQMDKFFFKLHSYVDWEKLFANVKVQSCRQMDKLHIRLRLQSQTSAATKFGQAYFQMLALHNFPPQASLFNQVNQTPSPCQPPGLAFYGSNFVHPRCHHWQIYLPDRYCVSANIQCSGDGAIPPATLAEFTLNGSYGLDFYDVSLVNGYNLPILIAPQGGTGGNCTITGCGVDLNNACPSELKVMDSENGESVACKSACDALKEPQYCCTGAYNILVHASPALTLSSLKMFALSLYLCL
ncbi:hypothetical protein GH714_015992 [Hevea brasiliensis]|uniref:Thaumatin-like protein n=1 Tax=Hevea brasiliensis TaxID=3981 RepID=A0A6A6M0V7_HEVBR|nr:hypothetical protein GH714_015992 [Hevea brasiliensis]